MKLSPREKDKLLVSMAAMVARNRKQRGVKLNYPEAIALISDFVVEGARDGRAVADLMAEGAHVVGRDDCMDGIAEMVHDVQVEAITMEMHFLQQKLTCVELWRKMISKWSLKDSLLEFQEEY